ncbi:hypothetical protein P3X46_024899 [Hevea brasiliensis]|uniref:Magnesium transporter n=1 Tax=Hevea brasiliensis TaxID=3981 RepID=A0ABQ9L7H9_HEVBR|nr:magnesium transporter MRS2-3 isoform X1 [Hevea brasiliensis]KAJ9159391.1 hypothetical protein P3X46_024899 [Hevea brasiliensis]
MRDSDPATALNTAPVLRKKGTGVRTWLMLDSTGQNQVLEAGKYSIMRRTGLPARDLRVLDPFLSYPSTVLGRERAIVINLEHIKAIIMAKEVLVLNSEDPFVKPFVQELERRILCYLQATKTQDDGEEDSKQSELVRPEKLLEDFFEDKGSMAERKQGFKNQDGSKVLPFEFVALEACLEAACSILENEANTLELEAHPALDKLTSHISTLNLERVRQIKSRIVATTGRVQRVRDELEHLLDDDGDMAEMYLTNKLFQRHLEPSSTSSTNEGDESDYEDAGVDDRMVPSEILLEAHGDNGSHGTYANSNIRDFNVGELEMLLEAYFVQTDGTLNKLSTLREYVDDTEDYINIMLDEKQNQLLQMGVMLTTATLVLTAFVVLAGVLGMNIRIHLFKISVQEGMPKWLWTTGSSSAGVIALYVMAIGWYKYKGYI